MSTILNQHAYSKLIEEDIAWLEANTNDSLERRHIIDVLRWVEKNYLTIRQIENRPAGD